MDAQRGAAFLCRPLGSTENDPSSSFYLVFPVVVVLDEVENEVEDVFRTEVLDVSEQRHGNRHCLWRETQTSQTEADTHVRAGVTVGHTGDYMR